MTLPTKLVTFREMFLEKKPKFLAPKITLNLGNISKDSGSFRKNVRFLTIIFYLGFCNRST